MGQLSLALSGAPARAQSFAQDLETRFPEATLVKFSYLPVLHGLVELDTHDSLKAIDLLHQASRYEMGWPGNDSVGFVGSLYPIYVRGLAYLAAHRGPEAVQQFQRIVGNPQIALMEPIGALAHLELGRAFALAQDTTNAKNAYRDFLNLWKDADPDIPILKQAKAEYALLY